MVSWEQKFLPSKKSFLETGSSSLLPLGEGMTHVLRTFFRKSVEGKIKLQKERKKKEFQKKKRVQVR
jgi:hypothetical protein